MRTAKVRVSESVWSQMEEVLFSRYPDREAATFLQCSWAEGVTSQVILIKDLVSPREGDVDSEIDLVGLQEQYSLRCALGAERNKFAVGLVHSHPEGYATFPSRIDDDMDRYYEGYFQGFAPERPYVSLIVSKNEDGSLRFSGRIFHRGEMIFCSHLQIVGSRCRIVNADNVEPREVPNIVCAQLERLTGAMGLESARKLWRSQVAIIGGGGTGSALFHSLVRSCVGRIVVIDPDHISLSNAERVHGYRSGDVGEVPLYKVDILKRLASELNPSVEVIAIPKNASSEEVQRYLIDSDFIFGCTDSQVGRVIISDIAIRFLLPAIHLNVAMVSRDRKLDAEVVHLTQYGPDLPCVYCRNQVDAQRLAQELMTTEERRQRQDAEVKMTDIRGMYWLEEPVLHTVGSLTTIAAELAANYAVGMLTAAYDIPAQFLELDLLKIHEGATLLPMKRRLKCMCQGRDGSGSFAGAWASDSVTPCSIQNLQRSDPLLREHTTNLYKTEDLEGFQR